VSAAGSSATTPIIPGFYPDPTICRVGEDYYLANSSFEYFPGAPIFHSRDLVTWTQIGNILTRRSQFIEGQSRPSMGIYGSTLRHHDGTFYFVTTNVSDYGSGQVLVTATDPSGPWSEPVFIRGAIGIDPDLCWDDDGECLLTFKHLDFDAGTAGIMQAILNTATGELVSPLSPVWQGTGAAHAEGPHLYRVGPWWYLLLAEGGTERGHSVTVARSHSPAGPFEPGPANPIFTRRSTAEPVQSVGHADLVTTPDGTWAMVHLGTRPRGSTPGFHVLGRETFLAAVTWDDAWPQVHADGFAIPAIDTAFVEDFADPSLDPRWVVPAGELDEITFSHRGATIPAGRFLCVRCRDLRWRAQALIDHGAFELRMDPKHALGVRVEGSLAQAYLRLQDVTTVLGEVTVDPGCVMLTIAALDPGGPPLMLGDAGPDDIALGVVLAGEPVELARFDGRYLSTEVAAGFTGRVLAVGSADVDTRVGSVTYSPLSEP